MLPAFLLALFFIYLPVTIAGCLLIRVTMFLHVVLGIQFPVITVYFIICILSLVLVGFLAIQKIPTDKRLLKKLDDLEKI